MNKARYKVRHIKCSMQDFNADCHRFRFEYNGNEYEVKCYGKLSCTFPENIPDDIVKEITDIIYRKIDEKEYLWRYPKEAYDIADTYCNSEFGKK